MVLFEKPCMHSLDGHINCLVVASKLTPLRGQPLLCEGELRKEIR
jgi:hypothetical protein